MASSSSPATSLDIAAGNTNDGPVLSLIGKKLRALKKKYNRILQMEEAQALGKPLNKEQEEVLRSKTAVAALIDEYEKLRQPLAVAVQEELTRAPNAQRADETFDAENFDKDDKAVEDLVTLLYFGCLFDVKQQNDFTAMMVTRNHERGCCLTYDYVTDDATELLGEKDLDAISCLGSLVTSRCSAASHKSALEECVEHAKLWLKNSDKAISLGGGSVTYAEVREKLKKILASDFYTTTAELKAPDDVAAAVGKYVSDSNEVPLPEDHTEDITSYQQEVEQEQENFQGTEFMPDDRSEVVDEAGKMDEADELNSFAETDLARLEQQKHEAEFEEHDQRDLEMKDHQYNSRGSYQNQRGGYRGGNRGGRRGYSNGRGGRGRGGNGGYQNGRSQYDSGYYPRNYYNTRGRGGRSGGSGTYYNHGGGSYGSHASEAVGA